MNFKYISPAHRVHATFSNLLLPGVESNHKKNKNSVTLAVKDQYHMNNSMCKCTPVYSCEPEKSDSIRKGLRVKGG